MLGPTSFSWPSTTATHSHSPPCCTHTAVLASKLAVANNLPTRDEEEEEEEEEEV